MAHVNPPDARVKELLEATLSIAVVGASSNPTRPSHGVMQRLLRAGYHLIPINPNETEVLGLKAFPNLTAVPERIDLVDVFRRPEHTPALAREAVAVGAKALWLQSGIWNDEAAELARAGGLTVVMDACLGVLHGRLGVRSKLPRV
jgi:predicted CoA-binding protein